jgi:hypothetical protein
MLPVQLHLRLLTLHGAEQDLGAKEWTKVALRIEGRNGKSCRLRWCNQLDPKVSKDPFTEWEVAVIVHAHEVMTAAPPAGLVLSFWMRVAAR